MIPEKNITAYDVALLIYEKYNDQFKYKNGKWYYLHDGEWILNKVNCAQKLQMIILQDVCELFAEMIYKNKINIDESTENIDINNMKEVIKNRELTKVLSKIYNENFQKRIIKECAEFFYDVNFVYIQ